MWMSGLQAVLSGLLLVGTPVSGSWVPPLASGWGEVLQRFDRPVDRFGPGHRGVDVAASVGAPVRAIGAGEVTFVGQVAGVTSVTIDHTSVRSTYLPVAPSVEVGQVLAAGEHLGTVAPLGHCQATCLHLGLRRPVWDVHDAEADPYLDPIAWITRTPVLKPVVSAR